MLAALNDFYDLTIPVYKRELVSMHFRTKIHSHVAFRTARIGWCVCQGRLSLSIIYSPDAKDHKTKNACRKSAGHLEFWMCVKLNQQFESVCDLDLFKTNNPTIFKYQNIPIWKKNGHYMLPCDRLTECRPPDIWRCYEISSHSFSNKLIVQKLHWQFIQMT